MSTTIVLTGATDGIGAASASTLTGLGYQVVLVGRSGEKMKKLAKRLDAADYFLADFERLDEVRRLADEIQRKYARIDVLGNNAGGLFSGPHRTVDGFERTFQVNHLAPFLLTHLLMDQLLESRASVINTSSLGARLLGNIDIDDLNTWKKFSPNRAYGNAKLANILFTKGLHARYHAQGLNSVSFHPGVVATNFSADPTSSFHWAYHTPLRRFLTSPERGGANLTHFLLGKPGQTWVSGEYYGSHRRIARTHRQASDATLVDEHWDRSAKMLGITS